MPAVAGNTEVMVLQDLLNFRYSKHLQGPCVKVCGRPLKTVVQHFLGKRLSGTRRRRHGKKDRLRHRSEIYKRCGRIQHGL